MNLRNALLSMLVMLAIVLIQVSDSDAQSRRVPILRDAEIEKLMLDYALPIMKVAGVNPSRVDIVLVNDRSFNAFVSGRKIFINVGAIVQSETPNELIGVIAHEIAHLAGGHLDRLRQQIDRAQTIAIVTAVVGVGAAVAAAAGGAGEAAGAGAGLAAGGAEIARRGLLAYQRTEELAADRAAVDYLNATGQSSKGLLVTFQRFQKNLALRSTQPNPYRISHPLPRERLSALETLAQSSPHFNTTDPAARIERHDRARAKILAYLYGASATQNSFRENANSLSALYGEAISTHLYANPRDAVGKMDALIRKRPNDPYFHEMKGEMLLRAQDVPGAIASFSKAVELSRGDAPTIQVALGHALVMAGDQQSLRRAVGELEVAIAIDPVNSRAYRHLAMAYGRLGETGNAELATAEANFHNGRIREAKTFAARAKRRFERNSPQWLRADDIMRFELPRRRR
ncbi:MAG: M48 family metalloprotease [Pseudomonadota bacterium]